MNTLKKLEKKLSSSEFNSIKSLYLKIQSNNIPLSAKTTYYHLFKEKINEIKVRRNL